VFTTSTELERPGEVQRDMAVVARTVMAMAVVVGTQHSPQVHAAAVSAAPEGWEPLAPLATPRMEHRCVAGPPGASDGVMALGGSPPGAARHAPRLGHPATAETSLRSTEIYFGGKWSAGPPMHSARAAFGAALLTTGGTPKLYVFGGMASDLPSGAGCNITDTAEVLRDGRWQQAPPMPCPRTGQSAATLPNGNEILIVGGFCSTLEGPKACPGITSPSGAPFAYTNKTLRFDGEKYTAAADLPCASGSAPLCGLSNLAVTTCGGKVWVIGGGGYAPSYADVHAYDPDADAWVKGPDLPEPKSWAASACVDKNGAEQLVVAGGLDGQFQASASVWILATDGGGKSGWVAGPPLPTPKAFTSGALLAAKEGAGTVMAAGGAGAEVTYGLHF